MSTANILAKILSGDAMQSLQEKSQIGSAQLSTYKKNKAIIDKINKAIQNYTGSGKGAGQNILEDVITDQIANAIGKATGVGWIDSAISIGSDLLKDLGIFGDDNLGDLKAIEKELGDTALGKDVSSMIDNIEATRQGAALTNLISNVGSELLFSGDAASKTAAKEKKVIKEAVEEIKTDAIPSELISAAIEPELIKEATEDVYSEYIPAVAPTYVGGQAFSPAEYVSQDVLQDIDLGGEVGETISSVDTMASTLSTEGIINQLRESGNYSEDVLDLIRFEIDSGQSIADYYDSIGFNLGDAVPSGDVGTDIGLYDASGAHIGPNTYIASRRETFPYQEEVIKSYPNLGVQTTGTSSILGESGAQWADVFDKIYDPALGGQITDLSSQVQYDADGNLLVRPGTGGLLEGDGGAYSDTVLAFTDEQYDYITRQGNFEDTFNFGDLQELDYMFNVGDDISLSNAIASGEQVPFWQTGGTEEIVEGGYSWEPTNIDELLQRQLDEQFVKVADETPYIAPKIAEVETPGILAALQRFIPGGESGMTKLEGSPEVLPKLIKKGTPAVYSEAVPAVYSEAVPSKVIQEAQDAVIRDAVPEKFYKNRSILDTVLGKFGYDFGTEITKDQYDQILAGQQDNMLATLFPGGEKLMKNPTFKYIYNNPALNNLLKNLYKEYKTTDLVQPVGQFSRPTFTNPFRRR